MELALALGVALVIAVIVTALIARRTPRGSGGAPGEVMGDEPLSSDTGASVEDHRHAGPAEDRPGCPATESTAPEPDPTPPIQET